MNHTKTITVLLADDDELILSDIEQLIPWKDLGFQIVAKAKNGKQALSLYKKHHPDIIITDIIMPIIDGIELIRQIKESDPLSRTQFLLLSSYKDFGYAKSAIQLGVSDYLLKPELTTQNLQIAIRKISANLFELARSKYEFSDLALTDFFNQEQDLPLSSYVQDEALQKGHFTFLLCSLTNNSGKRLGKAELSVLLKRTVLKLADQIALTAADCLFRADSFLVIGIANEAPATSDGISAWCRSVLDFFTSIQIKCFIQYSEKNITLSKFHTLYHMYNNHYRYQTIFSSGLAYTKLEYAVPKEKTGAAIVVNDYVEFERTAHKENGKELLLEQLEHIEKAKDYYGYKHFYQNACRYFRLDPMIESAQPLTSMSAVRSWLHSLFLHAEEQKLTTQDDFSMHVRNAILFIKNHYADPTLSVESVGLHIGISANRLSVLFKKELDTTVSEYLTDVRIQAAIELLRHSNLKIYEVATKVGYNSSQYFSRAFCKATGRKPLEYRNTNFTNYMIGDK